MSRGDVGASVNVFVDPNPTRSDIVCSRQKDDRSLLLPGRCQDAKSNDCLSARHVLALLSFLGFVNVYALRVNLSVALVAMVNATDDATNSSSECPDPYANSTSALDKGGDFDWNQQLQGYVLGAFFYGYILTQLPGGWLASRFGGKRLFGYGIMCTSILTIITPFAARHSIYLFIAVRVVEGIGEGVTFPAMHAMWGHWAPVWERSRLVAFSYAGSQIGTVLALPVSGLLIDSGLAGGWPSVFYVFGSVAVLWCIVWLLVVHDYPSQHPRISRAELLHIHNNSTAKMENSPTPWKHIFTSPALWGLAAAHFASNWGFYTLLTCLPTYMKNVLKFDMKENSLLSALPYAFCFICQNVAGIAADLLRSRGYLSTRRTRKLLTGIGVLLGITNGIATIPGFISPMVVGYLTNDNETRHQWEIIFYIAAGIYACGATVFIIFGRGEEQPWAKCVSSLSQHPPSVDSHSDEEVESREPQKEVAS